MPRACRRLALIVWFVSGSGCLPDVQDPPVFADEIGPVRDQWLDICTLPCARPDASPACGPFPGNPISCGTFDPQAARECYLAYRTAVAAEKCTNEARSVKTIEESCGDVYDACIDPGDGGDTDTDGDTEETEG